MYKGPRRIAHGKKWSMDQTIERKEQDQVAKEKDNVRERLMKVKREERAYM